MTALAHEVSTCRIDDESSLLAVRATLRHAATALGFGVVAQTKLVTAASELARNILRYAGAGTMRVEPVERDGRIGLRARFEDHGPGIEDLELALQDGYSTAGSLGIGLPGARRLVDEFEIATEVGRGTVVVVTAFP